MHNVISTGKPNLLICPFCKTCGESILILHSYSNSLVAIYESVHYLDGRVAEWLERLTAEQNIDGSSRTLGS